MKETKKLKEKTLAKEKVEGMVEKNHPRKQLDTIVNHPNKTILLWIRVAHGLPP